MSVRKKVIKKLCEEKSTQFTLDNEWMDENNVAKEALEEVLNNLEVKEGYIIYNKEFDQGNCEYGFVIHPQKSWLEQGYQKHCKEK